MFLDRDSIAKNIGAYNAFSDVFLLLAIGLFFFEVLSPLYGPRGNTRTGVVIITWRVCSYAKLNLFTIILCR